MKRLRRAAVWISRAAIALALGIVVINAGLVLVLFGAREGASRLMGDWRRITVAHQMAHHRLTPQEAFAKAYARELGASPDAKQIRAYIAQDLEAGEPAVFDVILARYILARFGAIDGRTVPSGIYLAAGPIGPDNWPAPLATQYLIFPRHGYLLVVPSKQGEAWPPAYEATASLRSRFRRSGDADALYAVVQPYGPGAYDFPTAGEPLHDLLLVSDTPADVRNAGERLISFSRDLDDVALAYRLLRRNSNSALACYLKATGLTSRVEERVKSRLLLRLRLPGITGAEGLPC